MEGSASPPNPWVDKSWLQKVMRDVERDRYLLVSKYSISAMGGKGENYLSEMQRINMKVRRSDHSESEISVVVKNIPSGKEMQKTLMVSTAFPNEVRMFREILPKFHEILDRASPGKYAPFAARYIYSELKETRYLIVGDLAAEGFRMANRKEGLDMDHCLLLVRTLGRYHATSIALHAEDPSLVESFEENMFTEESSKDFVCSFTKMTVGSVSEMVRSWPDCGERMAEKIKVISSTFRDIVKEQLRPHGNRLNVLTHGDLWVNNVLFKYDEETGAVEDIRFVDFQMSRYTSFAMDLQYFIHTSPKDSVRAGHTEDLLKEYHEELTRTLHLLGQGHRAISFCELVEEYEKKSVYGFLMSLMILPIIQSNTEDATDLEVFLSGGDESAKMNACTGNQGFVNVMKRLLPLYEKKGYF